MTLEAKKNQWYRRRVLEKMIKKENLRNVFKYKCKKKDSA